MRIRSLAAASVLAVTMAGATGAVSAAPSQNTKSQENRNPEKRTSFDVQIAPGDTLIKIGEEHGATYVRLFNANEQISDPDLIYAGESVRIPAPDEELEERELPEKVVQAEASAPQALQSAPEKPQAYEPAAAEPAVAINGGVWDRIAMCESGGNWAINTGNGYYGGLQFSLSSWRAVGGSGYPHQASKSEQISRAESLLAIQGWGAWPACSSKLGLR